MGGLFLHATRVFTVTHSLQQFVIVTYTKCVIIMWLSSACRKAKPFSFFKISQVVLFLH